MVIKITEVEGAGVPVDGNDIDTDRIIPARYLKEITFSNMGNYAFYDERFDEDGKQKPHPLNDPKFKVASILIVNKNFGCGSSREHAPQSILRYGIRAIVGESFAEIFAGNCTMLGIPTVTMAEKDILELMAAVRESPQTPIRICLPDGTLSYGDRTRPARLDGVVKRALADGLWDSTSLMLEHINLARAKAATLPYLRGFSSPTR